MDEYKIGDLVVLKTATWSSGLNSFGGVCRIRSRFVVAGAYNESCGYYWVSGVNCKFTRCVRVEDLSPMPAVRLAVRLRKGKEHV